jgi:hypothetical protein
MNSDYGAVDRRAYGDESGGSAQRRSQVDIEGRLRTFHHQFKTEIINEIQTMANAISLEVFNAQISDMKYEMQNIFDIELPKISAEIEGVEGKLIGQDNAFTDCLEDQKQAIKEGFE